MSAVQVPVRGDPPIMFEPCWENALWAPGESIRKKERIDIIIGIIAHLRVTWTIREWRNEDVRDWIPDIRG
jgi:hypothetical protein